MVIHIGYDIKSTQDVHKPTIRQGELLEKDISEWVHNTVWAIVER
jgi:hypothetical protein